MKTTENTNSKRAFRINNSHISMIEGFEQETEKAVQVRILNLSCGSNKLFWIPKSVFKIEENGIMPIVSMADWFFNKNFGYIK